MNSHRILKHIQIQITVYDFLWIDNGKYVAIAAECLPEGFKARQLRAEYKMEAHLSDMIYPKSKAFGNRVLVSLENSEQKPYAVVEFWEEDV